VTELVGKYGADVLRLWVASENYHQDIRLSPEILTRTQDAYRRIRNTFRFMLGNLGDFTAEDALPPDQLEEADRWALHRMQELRERVLAAYAAYEFHTVYHAVHNACSVDLSSFYLDIVKDRLYTFAVDSRERRAAQTAMAAILVDLLKLLAPILVYTCDEAWQHLPEHLKTAENVHLARFPTEEPGHHLAADRLASWDELLRVRGVVSKALEQERRAGLIGSSLEARVTLTPGQEQTAAVLQDHAAQLPWVFIVSACHVAPLSEEAAESEEQLLVTVERATGEKCVRCWNYGESVGANAAHPKICGRCVAQLGDGNA